MTVENVPASIFDKSRMSSISDNRIVEEFLLIDTNLSDPSTSMFKVSPFPAITIEQQVDLGLDADQLHGDQIERVNNRVERGPELMRRAGKHDLLALDAVGGLFQFDDVGGV
eukprot:CAMPEP_0168350558 /NCGR_PEP_ID=MMETSP0213-20121227/21207_1 /TAXON_ID=151035 /ORGANISM="Euplotes harpa, Strain FSP1.4" /LENGTH=111 /DNA_ID=CAMNT_0008360961 /DNA_START=292 /DNA_END=623 /DNA_ORIENTATION=+